MALTCRYLRAVRPPLPLLLPPFGLPPESHLAFHSFPFQIASPLLLQEIKFDANNKASFAPLEALVGNEQKGALVR